jgi:hypothetical protein
LGLPQRDAQELFVRRSQAHVYVARASSSAAPTISPADLDHG